MSNKPDNVSDNPGLLPYGSNVGAPAIKVLNIEHWKEPRVLNVNKQFEDRFEQLKKEYQKLIDEYKWNDLVYKSKFSFEPVIGPIVQGFLEVNVKNDEHLVRVAQIAQRIVSVGVKSNASLDGLLSESEKEALLKDITTEIQDLQEDVKDLDDVFAEK